MTHRLDTPLALRFGAALNVLLVCLTSGFDQAPRNLVDREAQKRSLGDAHSGEHAASKVLISRASGDTSTAMSSTSSSTGTELPSSVGDAIPSGRMHLSLSLSEPQL